MLDEEYTCNSCGIKGFEHITKFVLTVGGEKRHYCRNCVRGTSGVKDVWYGYGSGTHTEENICDPATGQPIPFSSKRGKWEAMQKAGIREAGDTVHGSRTTYTGK